MSQLEYLGNICLSDIPKEVIKKSERNGKLYLSFSVRKRDKVSDYGDTHFISCAPRKEERNATMNYIIGNMKPFVQQQPSVDEVQKAAATTVEKMPWE